jgi:formate dehydrogenase major subunit
VIVIGGGNTAIDAARCARRGGATVTILYRRSREEMPASGHEIDAAQEEGVELVILAAPLCIERAEDGTLTALQAQRMRLGDPDSSGRRRPLSIENSSFVLPADTVIAAVSQIPVLEGLESLDHDGDWLIADAAGAVDSDVIAGGDVLGPGIAGEAIVQGRRAAETLDSRFRGKEAKVDKALKRARVHADAVMFASKPQSEAAHARQLPGEERIARGMEEVSQTIHEDDFLTEVERCFSCGSCFGCEQCFMYCTAGCFTKVEEAGPGMYFTLNLDACEECGKCVEVCPCGFLEVS